MYPLTRRADTAIFLAIFSAITVAVQSWLGPGAWWIAWVNWLFTAVLALGIGLALGRHHLDQGPTGILFTCRWIAMSATANILLIGMPPSVPWWQMLLCQAALLLTISILLSTWQQKNASLPHLYIGLIIGILSTLIPNTLGWLVLIPVASYHLRSLSARNWWNVVTGTLLGIWSAYCLWYLLAGEGAATALVGNYATLLNIHAPTRPALSLWAWALVGLYLLLILLYSILALLGTSHVGSLRVRACEVLIASLSIVIAVMALLDPEDLALYLGLLSVFLSIQLSIHQLGLASSIGQWWTIVILVVLLLFGSIPLIIPIL